MMQTKKEDVNDKQLSYFIGIDLGTSFVKVALLDSRKGVIDIVRTPQTQMKVYSEKDFFCEQDPQDWWKNVCQATFKLHSKYGNIFSNKLIKGIGISYQMHGLVLVNEDYKLLRKAIIWSDSRTHQVGVHLKELVKQNRFEQNLLNYPGNFTISKLKWVQENQPQIYKKIHKILLPGDYIALRLSNQCRMSETGLSEGIFWDFKSNQLSRKMLQICGISINLIPQIVRSFSFQGEVCERGEKDSMIPQQTPILYRSGDQPNNAYTLNVTEVGEVAASGGTSGTVLLVSDQKDLSELSRINTFLHVNHSEQSPRYAKLLCINSCGIVYNWLRNNFAPDKSYEELNKLAESCESQGLMVIPFGNGLQRMLNHSNVKASIRRIDFNRHGLKHIIRAGLQSIAFSFIYGIKILKQSSKKEIQRIKCSNDNIFNCKLIVDIIECVLGCEMVIVEGVTGAVGSAKGAIQSWELLNALNTHILRQKSSNQNLTPKQPKSKHKPETQQHFLKLYQAWQGELFRSTESGSQLK